MEEDDGELQGNRRRGLGRPSLSREAVSFGLGLRERPPLNEEQVGLSSALPAADLMIVFARKEQERTLAICERLRKAPDRAATPLLLVIGRYEISQGSAMRNTGRATFIIAPFGEKELRANIDELLGSSHP